MIESIEIENLRGIAHGKLDGLTPLTILVGPNGSGKSTILDALLIATHGGTGQGVQIALSRRSGNHNQSKWLIKRNPNKKATLKLATESGTLSGKVKFDEVSGNLDFLFPQRSNVTDPNIINALDTITPGKIIDERDNYQAPLYELYSQIIEQGTRDSINALIADIVPEFSNIEILTERTGGSVSPLVHIVFKGTRGSVPVSLAGDGIHALIRMAMEIQLCDGLALIEEPEAHQHPATIRQVAKAIYASVRKNNQVVLTTHSIELIDALLDAATEPGDLDKLSVFWVTLNDGELKSVRIPGEDVAFERENLGKDLR